MADFLSWRDEWCTGIDWVDCDHREMVGRLNRLAEACGCDDAGSPPDRASVLGSLEAVLDHNRGHFQEEEAFLRQIAYPGLEEHCLEHATQMAELRSLYRDLERDPAARLGREAFADIKRWFFDHVIAQDRHYAEWYRARSQDPGTSPSGRPGRGQD